MRVTQELHAQGHHNIVAKHPTTFEITRASQLTLRGDCVVAVQATKGLRELSAEFKRLCRNDGSRILVQLQAAGISELIEGRGSHRLTLSHACEIVVRKSGFISDRTLMIHSDKAACDISRDLIKVLSCPMTRVSVRITVEF